MKSKYFGLLLIALLFFLSESFAQTPVALDDYASTSPLQKIRVNVVLNDTLTCNNYTLRLISNLDPVTQGVATFDNEFLVFTPAANCRNTTVKIKYGLTCNVEVTATLSVFVAEYSIPLNIVPSEAECTKDMPASIPFGIRSKFVTETPSNADYIDGFSIPLVGDLDGDGKPEIVTLGISEGTWLRSDGRFIDIFNGQDGTRIVHYDLQKNGFANSSGNQFRLRDGAPYHNAPSQLAIADLDNDGRGEIVVCETGSMGRIYALKPVVNAGKTITGLSKMWETTVNYKLPLTGFDYKTFGRPMPYIADLNGDGIPEIIVYNKVYNGRTGVLLMAWQGAAASPKQSSVETASKGLFAYKGSEPYTSETCAKTMREYAMVGRRLNNNDRGDAFVAVCSIVDIDGDGIQEIITGTRIYKIKINSLTDHTKNTYTTVEGPTKIDLPASEKSINTHFLHDGFTRVADIDGDGALDIIVATYVRGYIDMTILLVVWDPRNATVKAATTFFSDGHEGNFGIPFVGDINGKTDGGWNGKNYTKQLPEICIISGNIYINRTESNYGRSGILFHSLTDNKLRQGTMNNTGTDAGWDNNQTTNTSRRFNRRVQDKKENGHVIGLTYDDKEKNIENRLKLSWTMEHSDGSNNTGMTLFDFDNDNAMDICYRDMETLRVISPKKGKNDYVVLGETEWINPAILFNTAVISYTAFEAPAIADVNMDGSADIIVTKSFKENESRGAIQVFEYKGQKWAPAPPVWNQAMYEPLQINENLTVPAKPQSMLAPYIDASANTIYPYNGQWIQQPIVKAGQAYTPVYRLPDPVIADMKVKVINLQQAEVTLTIRNRGAASVNANTPIAFYNAGSTGLPIEKSGWINTLTVGVDIFRGEKVTRKFILLGNFNDIMIWARIMDDGNTFPAAGYEDCDPSNNTASGADCPYLNYTISASPDDIICGNRGSITLTANPASTPRYNPTYQWYLNEIMIPGATGQSYATNVEGNYTCFVTENICRQFTPVKTLVKKYIETHDDYAGVIEQMSALIDILANDYIPANCMAVVHLVQYPQNGTANVSTDNKIHYTANQGFHGVDKLSYSVAGIESQVYIVVNKPLSQQYLACPGKGAAVGFVDIAGVEYNWYGGSVGGNIIAGGAKTNIIQVTKDATAMQSWWIETTYKSVVINRHRVDLILNGNCGTTSPTGCAATGTVFRKTKHIDEFDIDNLCPGSRMTFSAWLRGSAQYPVLTVAIEDLNGNVISTFYSGEIGVKNNPAKVNYSFDFMVPASTDKLKVKIMSNPPDDIVIDNIEILFCSPQATISENDMSPLCSGAEYTLTGRYADDGALGDELFYHWEFRRAGSSVWETREEGVSFNPVLDLTLKLNPVNKTDEGFYRLSVEPFQTTGRACRAISDTVFLKVLKVTQVPDIRVKICPQLEKEVRLTSFLDSLDSNIIKWSKVNPTSPNINPVTGDVDIVNFLKHGTYTYKYSSSTKCGTTSAIAYINTVTDFVFNQIDTIMIDKNQELSKFINMNGILGLELNGQWKYDEEVNPDDTVLSNVTMMLSPSIYSGAVIFNAQKAWNEAGSAYFINYKGVNNARKFTFQYKGGICAKNLTKTIVLIVV
jgi:hypothetical protein